VAETQNCAFIRKTPKLVELSKLTIKRRIKEGLFNARIGKRESLLHEVNTKHGWQGKRWPPGLAFRIKGRNAFD
jgi:hypothetical protein